MRVDKLFLSYQFDLPVAYDFANKQKLLCVPQTSHVDGISEYECSFLLLTSEFENNHFLSATIMVSKV